MSFLKKENQIRLDGYKKDSSEEDFLKHLNQTLTSFDPKSIGKDQKYPWIFVTGLPRSGTTLLMQLLASSFEFCYIDNFMARLWDAPVTAARLSKILSNQQPFLSDFSSDYGKSQLLNDVHEWSYFWIKHLKYSRTAEFNRKQAQKEIDWSNIGLILNAISNVFERPFLNKALHPAKYVDSFLSLNSNTLFIHIERDFLDNCQSIYEARIKYYGNPDTWWSIIPDNYAQIEDLPYYEQIPLQLRSLSKEMKADLATFAKDRSLYINYRDLCEKPKEILSSVADKVNAIFNDYYGFNLSEIPDHFSYHPRTTFDSKLKDYVHNIALENQY